MSRAKLSLKRAVKFILLSTLVISGSAAFGILYYLHVQEVQLQDERYNITTIAHIGSREHSLPTAYLAEILELTGDAKRNLFAFDIERAHERLTACPVIRSAEIVKIRPGTIGVSYTLRTPRMRVANRDNLGVDEKGYLIPIEPFFKTSILPELALGTLICGERIDPRALSASVNLLDQVGRLPNSGEISVERIDLTKMDAESYGKREILLTLRESSKKWDLRLRCSDFEKQLEEFARVRSYHQTQDSKLIIDLRIPQLAFISATR